MSPPSTNGPPHFHTARTRCPSCRLAGHTGSRCPSFAGAPRSTERGECAPGSSPAPPPPPRPRTTDTHMLHDISVSLRLAGRQACGMPRPPRPRRQILTEIHRGKVPADHTPPRQALLADLPRAGVGWLLVACLVAAMDWSVAAGCSCGLVRSGCWLVGWLVTGWC